MLKPSEPVMTKKPMITRKHVSRFWKVIVVVENCETESESDMDGQAADTDADSPVARDVASVSKPRSRGRLETFQRLASVSPRTS